MAAIRVDQLTVYPVKSLGGVSVEQFDLTVRGPAYDRRWMLTSRDGSFITQRRNPILSQCTVGLTGERIEIECQGSTTWLPLELSSGASMDVRIWKDTVAAMEGPPEAAEWFSDLLGFECRPVFMPEYSRRRVNPRFSPNGAITAFTDGFPILLTAKASLEDLNGRLDEPIPMSRFRPNIVVSGAEPFDEDQWQTVHVGNAVIRGVKPCSRCVMTTIDPRTLSKDKEPLRTLATFRRWGVHVYFGENFIVESVGTVRVGDDVEVASRKTQEEVARSRL